MDPFPSCSARRLGGPVLVAVVALLVATSAGPALAHGDEGLMEITRFEQRGPGSVELEVGVVYANDDHQAGDATVTATMTGADGTTVGPVDLVRVSDTGSLYAASIPLPAGTWTALVESTDPDATANGSIEVTDTPVETTAASPATESAPTEPTTTTVSGVERDSVAVEETAAALESDDGGGSTGLLIAAAVVAVAVIGGGAFLASRRRDPAGDRIE